MFKALLIAASISFGVLALTPLDGIVKGQVTDIEQYEPLRGLFSRSFNPEVDKDEQAVQIEKLELYRSLYDLGDNLSESCQIKRYHTYKDSWTERVAKRSVAATLQMVGIDIASRAIVEYAKSFKVSDEEFKNITNNLVVNTCSPNISVYSHRLIKNNLEKMWKEGTNFKLPTLDNFPFVTEFNKVQAQTLEAKEREFNLALQNFRDFCSWNGDVDNYRLMAPYLSNPFVMSLVHLQLIHKEMRFDHKKQDVLIEEKEDSTAVICEDLICRKTNKEKFLGHFPRMAGTISVQDDLNVLFCNHFRDAPMSARDESKQVRKWINDQSIAESKIAPMSFLSLVTGVPDFFTTINNYKSIADMFSNTIERRWDVWAKKQTETLVLDLLFEESLYVDLAPASIIESTNPDLGLTFDFTLGELDREIKVVDKLSSVFHINLTESYMAWLRRAYIAANNKSDYQEMARVKEKFKAYLDLQLKTKEEFFSVSVWNESFSDIIASEIINRLISTDQQIYDEVSQKQIRLPVKFRFGLFALKYLRDKYKAKFHANP